MRARGPWDISEIEDSEGRMDFGSLLIQQQQGIGIRLEVTEKGNRPRAVNLDHKGSTVQLQAFAAPRTTGIWAEIRKDLVDSLKRSDGAPQAVEGPFGTELRARFPATTSDGTKGYRPARFIALAGGLVEIGHDAVTQGAGPGGGFCFDNELPRHRQWPTTGPARGSWTSRAPRPPGRTASTR